MDPAPGERLVRFVGDRIRFALRDGGGHKGWRALLRTNLGARGHAAAGNHRRPRRRRHSRRSFVARFADAKGRRRLAD